MIMAKRELTGEEKLNKLISERAKAKIITRHYGEYLKELEKLIYKWKKKS